jgi:hypothetical protein
VPSRTAVPNRVRSYWREGKVSGGFEAIYIVALPELKPAARFADALLPRQDGVYAACVYPERMR